MDSPPLASLSLTHVRYDPDDLYSCLSAYLALVPQALTITYVALIWGTREIEILLMFAGQMGCEALNWLLKRYIKEERPTRRWTLPFDTLLVTSDGLMRYHIEMLGKGYGMPSSHAQFVAFFSTFLSLFLLFRHDPHNHPSASNTHIPTPFWQRVALALLSLVCAAAVAHSRIYLNYHTEKQVYVGVTAGIGCAVGWFVVTSIARQYGLVDQLLEFPPLNWLRFRDLVTHETLEDAGWGRWELSKKRRAELRGKKSK